MTTIQLQGRNPRRGFHILRFCWGKTAKKIPAVKIVFNKKICVPVSFLVDRNDRFSKMNLEKLTIKYIDIKAK